MILSMGDVAQEARVTHRVRPNFSVDQTLCVHRSGCRPITVRFSDQIWSKLWIRSVLKESIRLYLHVLGASCVNKKERTQVHISQMLRVFLIEKMMSLIWGTLLSSRILAYGMGMSTPVTLVTGASR